MTNFRQSEKENRSGAGTTRPANDFTHSDANNNRGHFTNTTRIFTVEARSIPISEAERRRRLALVYDVLLEAAEHGRNEKGRGHAQLDSDETQRTCLRCGGDAYRDGDGWRCWNCGEKATDT